jgi:aspartyl-tRNA(Asn)/glutamyl-tRNA(Gln) amidotransferase subunit A
VSEMSEREQSINHETHHVVSLQSLWSRRHFVKAGLCADGIILLAKATDGVTRATQVRQEDADLITLSIREVSEMIRRRVISPVDLTRASLQQIERLNPKLNAFITLTADQAMSQARAAETEVQRKKWRGPLHGIPVGIKDNIDTAGVRTTSASAVFKDRIPSMDSEVVRRLKTAGAVLLGKQNLHEVAFGTSSAVSYFGAVHNPWKLDHIAGGSSGGSAAAVAANLCFAAVGTDAGGSIRVPSAYCGTVGLKPTYGLVSMRGSGDAGWWSMNHVGPICRSVTDAALLLSAIAGYDPTDNTSVHAPRSDYITELFSKISGLRMGIPRAHFYDNLDATIELAINRALRVLGGLMAGLREVNLEPIPSTTAANIILAENYAFHEPYFLATPDLYHSSIRRNLEQAAKITTAAYIRSRRELDAVRRAIAKAFSNIDVLITPTTSVPPPTIEEAVRQGVEFELIRNRNTSPFNVYGLPTISIPCGFTSTGLPIGMQISGPPFGEAKVLAVAHAYEQATDWHTKRPRAL